MLAASFGPEVVEEKGSENVKQLPPVREATRVVSLEVRGVVFLFEDSFPEKDEGPGDGEAVGGLPFLPRATKGIPGLLGGGAIHEAAGQTQRDPGRSLCRWLGTPWFGATCPSGALY